MDTRESIQLQLEELKSRYGEWTYDIPLPFDIWTGGNLKIPHTRLKRILQVVGDLSEKPLSDCRVLDLGCLDGIFSIEFASHGAQTIGVEIREANIKKAIFCKEILKLDNLDFRQDDARNISVESYGKFDVIICSGLLYHLPGSDVPPLIKTMCGMTNRLLVIDTHVALDAKERFMHDGDTYWGENYYEHSDDSTQDKKEKKLWSSWDNPASFWFTRPSLINMLSKIGFSSVYECFIPAHINFGKPGVEHRNRCTFVAIKGETCKLSTSPAANELREKWPENSLSYSASEPAENSNRSLYRRILKRLKKMLA
jgi:SAM-dependent methyltransferase